MTRTVSWKRTAAITLLTLVVLCATTMMMTNQNLVSLISTLDIKVGFIRRCSNEFIMSRGSSVLRHCVSHKCHRFDSR